MEILTYHIETAICLSIFYIVYLLFFKYETFFKYNRFVLLASLALSFTIPLIELPTTSGGEAFIFPPIEIQSRITEITVYAESNTDSINFISLLPYLYLSGIAISFAMLIFNFYKIGKIKKSSVKINIDGCEIHLLEGNINPFTFIKNIFISKSSLEEENIIEVVRHEKVHARQWHTLDILLLEVLKTFQWFNPVIFLFGREIREIHEYIADSEVLASSDAKNTYIDTMLSLTIGAPLSSLANNFSGIKLIKRLKMIAKPKSRKSLAAKYLMMIPAVLVLLLAFSCKDENSTTSNGDFFIDTYPTVITDRQQYEEYKKNPEIDISKYQLVDEYPRMAPGYENSDEKIYALSKIHKKYLKEKKAIKVVVKYIVTDDGSIKAPNIVNYKFADAKNWSKKKLHIDIESDVFYSVLLSGIKYTPAMKDGKPIESYAYRIIILGDESVWNRYNLGKTVYYGNDDGTMKGLEVPYTKPKSEDKSGAAMISGEQLRFIASSLVYPEKAKKAEVEGTVVISFIVGTDGKITDAKVEEGIGYGCDEEALRVVKMMPDFAGEYKPNAKTNMRIPIKFKLRYDGELPKIKKKQ